jgi:ankyrin repeat protein
MRIAHRLWMVSAAMVLLFRATVRPDDSGMFAALNARDTGQLTAAILEGGNPNAFDNKGRSALWVARWESSYECFRQLLTLGADPNAPAVRGGGSVLADLVGVDAKRYLQAYHEFGGVLDTHVQNARGDREHFLLRVVRLGDVDSIFYVLAQGVSRSVKDEQGRSPLQVAIDLRRFQVAYFLLQQNVFDPTLDSKPDRFLRLSEPESLRNLKVSALYWREKVHRELRRRWGLPE